ncbi:DUF2231 domain-containing protein [Calditrichota bacterium LG25]
MNLIPEWMSNVHPLIVHFPIALLVIAVLTDFLALILKRYGWLKPAALWLYVLGALGTIGAYFSGKQAADVVTLPTASYSVIGTHADLALYTMLFFGVYAVLRLFFAWKKWDQKFALSLILFVVAAGGLGLVQQTAERGGELVFRFGVGTNALLKVEENPAQKQISAANIEVEENGSWFWQANEKAALQFRQNFKLIKGRWDDLILQGAQTENNQSALNIQINTKKAFVFAFGPELKNVQISARVRLADFNGRFLLAHHILQPNTYDFLAVENKAVRLGRLEKGKVKIFDTGARELTPELTLKVVSSKGHYRGYVNGQLIVHGHGSDLKPGQTGFALLGSGQLQIKYIKVVSLDEGQPMMHMEMQNMPQEQKSSEHGH